MKTDQNTKNLFRAILSLKDEKEAQKFFRDLLTESEIKEFANRWKVAQMLDKKVRYEIIAKETGMSSTTIARINKWVQNGMGGYKLMLKRLKNKSKSHHSTPLVAL
jgi:TrpR-related protein YerC/YecD